MEIDLNEIIISGTINNVTDNNKDYINECIYLMHFTKRYILLF